MDPLDGRNQVMTTQSTRNLLAVAPVILVLLLPLTNLGGGAPLGTVEKSWNQTFVVPATDGVVLGGMLYLSNTQVNGSFTVKSCCGYSTNDIKFSIGLDYVEMKSYGVVVGNLTFSWNTGVTDKFDIYFDNAWGQVCAEGVCHADPSNPSSHNKTIELSVREAAPATLFSLITKRNIIIGVAVMVGTVVVASTILIVVIGLESKKASRTFANRQKHS